MARKKDGDELSQLQIVKTVLRCCLGIAEDALKKVDSRPATRSIKRDSHSGWSVHTLTSVFQMNFHVSWIESYV